MKCEDVCVYAHKGLEKEIQARAPQGTPNTRHPSALPRYATLPCGPNPDRPAMGLEQASLLEHPSFLVACQRNPCSKGMRGTEVSTFMSSLLPTSFLCFHLKPLTPAVRSGIISILAVPQVVWLLNLG